MACPGSGVMGVRRDAVSLGVVAAGTLAAGLAFFAAAFALSGCSASAVIDDASPRCEGAAIAAGSELTDASQYVEVRLAFDAPLEAVGSVADDLDVLVDEEPVDAKTMQLEASVDGSDVVVRLTPSSAAGGSSPTVYFALYGGLVSVGAKSADGGLAHVKAAGGGSNAVLENPRSFTVPSGIRIGSVESVAGDASSGTLASVSFSIEQFAQLRCCTWFSFGTDAPLVLMHNHEYLRDTEKTCAKRLADTVNDACGGVLAAEADGARVTVRALEPIDGQELTAAIVEGEGAEPSKGKSIEMPGVACVSASSGVFGLFGALGGVDAAADGSGAVEATGGGFAAAFGGATAALGGAA